jgi:hypothetical protein
MLVWQPDTMTVAVQDAAPPSGELKVERPAAETVRETRLASRMDPPTFRVRPTSGYLEARYVALTQGVGDLQLENGTEESASSPNGAGQSATPWKLLEEFIPKRMPQSHSSS